MAPPPLPQKSGFSAAGSRQKCGLADSLAAAAHPAPAYKVELPGRGAGGSLSTLDAGARGYRAAGGCPGNKDSEPVRSRTSKKTCRATSDEVGSVKTSRFRADVWKTRAKPCVSQRLRGRRELRKKGSPKLLFSSLRHVFHEDAVNTHGLPHVF